MRLSKILGNAIPLLRLSPWLAVRLRARFRPCILTALAPLKVASGRGLLQPSVSRILHRTLSFPFKFRAAA